MSPEARKLLRRPIHWDPVDKQDFVMVLVCTHLAALFLGYLWGRG